MNIAEPNSEKRDNAEKADHLRQVNYGRRDYIDQFTTLYSKEGLVRAALATLRRLPKCLENKK